MSVNNRVAILIPAWDDYSDLWAPFLKLLFRFWPNCAFKIYLPTYKNVDIENVEVIHLRDGYISWSDLLIKTLKLVNEDYVLIFFQDLFLIGYVDNDKILKVINWMDSIGANYVRLNPSPKPDRYYNDMVGIIAKGSVYRASTMFSVWKKDVLLDLLRPKEDAWGFEIKGSERSDKYDGFYCTWDKYFKYVNGVVKGKWERRALRKIQGLGVEVDLKKRKVMDIFENLRFYLKEKRTGLFLSLMPSKYRRKARCLFLK